MARSIFCGTSSCYHVFTQEQIAELENKAGLDREIVTKDNFFEKLEFHPNQLLFHQQLNQLEVKHLVVVYYWKLLHIHQNNLHVQMIC